ncbi:MAG: putative Ig domain-containing protein, partial [candidate division Zixibacteria bacterium]|nr:putative Ig domain-containing protein [candidate division Zixibacteria bacterium]
FAVSASDAESTPTLSASGLPAGASFIDNLNGTGTFFWTPTFLQSGVFSVTFTATDDSLSVDSEVVSITVIEAGNQLPVLAAIGSQSTTENVNLAFAVSASDAESTPALSASGLPAGASFTDNLNGTGSFSWTPTFLQSGVFSVTFTATDDSLAVDSEVVAITVIDAGNQLPVLAAIGAQSTTEGVNLNFAVSASDVDGSAITLSTSALPNAASFTDNGDGTGTFNWTPLFNQSGTYLISFIATDDSLGVDSEVVTITVNESGNHPPVLSPIGNKSITEGANLLFILPAVDPDSTIPTLTASPLPAGALLINNGDGTHTFDWTPDFTQAGSLFNVTFVASDGGSSDSELININVIEAGNQAPTLAVIGPQVTSEGVNLNFALSATDPDGTSPALSATGLPSGSSLTDNGNGTATFDWTPAFDQAGVFNVTFFTTDGVLADSELVQITVNDAGNQAPVLAAIGPQGVTEGALLSFIITASDPDATIPLLSAANLPAGATFTDNADGTGSFAWTPDFTQGGLSYNVTFTATDGAISDSEIVTITVADLGNQAPVLAVIGARSVTEGALLSFGTSATDPDATTPSLSAANLPPGATFTDNADGTGSFNWTPDFTQAGSFGVTFVASDGVLADSELVTITVNEAGNQAPVLATIGPQSGLEGSLLSINISSTDPDGDIAALTTSLLPAGAVFTDNGDGTGLFSWTPDFTQAGSFFVVFNATDPGLAGDSEIVSITINEAGNQTPILALIGAQSVTENALLAFGVSATDPDATTPSLLAIGLPLGAVFVDNGNGSGSFNWTPDFTQAGLFSVTFIASDGAVSDSEIVSITVVEAGNQTPVLAAIGPQSTIEGTTLSFAVSAADLDGTIPTLNALTLPAGSVFTDNLDGTGAFDWTPGFTQSGVFAVTFIASDASLAADTEIVTITVTDAGNQTPVLAAIGAQSVTENTQLLFTASAADAEGVAPSLSAAPLPAGATFIDNGNGTGTFDWTPDFTQSGSFDVTFSATDDSLAVDLEVVTITVVEAGNQTPVLAAIGAQFTTEGASLNFAVSAADADLTTPT